MTKKVKRVKKVDQEMPPVYVYEKPCSPICDGRIDVYHPHCEPGSHEQKIYVCSKGMVRCRMLDLYTRIEMLETMMEIIQNSYRPPDKIMRPEGPGIVYAGRKIYRFSEQDIERMLSAL